MRRWTTMQGLALVATMAALGTGCKDDDDPAPPANTAWPVVYSDVGGGNGKVRQDPNDATRRSLAGTFLASYTLASTFTWILDAPVFFGDQNGSVNPVLTIQAGTTVLGRGGTPPSMLVIYRGAQINANGTAGAPIVFTSAQPVGSRAAGDWGGLIINRWGQVNQGSASAPPQGEGGTGPYGGFSSNGTLNNADNSGTMRYVRVEYAGHIFTSTNELNGIAFQGVGNGTTVEYVQVHQASDDGIEFFGGTVDVKYLLVTGAQDDSIDWTFGYSGRIQFAVVQQYSGAADSGLECDGNGSNHTATPRSLPMLSNLTIIGPAGTTAPGGRGMHLKAGTGGDIFNAIFTDLQGAALDIDNQATYDFAYSDAPSSYNTISGNLTVQNTIFQGTLADFDADSDTIGTGTATGLESTFNSNMTGSFASNIQTATAQIQAPTNQTSPDFRAVTGTAAMTTGWVDPNSADSFWVTVTFIGAMDDTTDWTNGWKTTAQN